MTCHPSARNHTQICSEGGAQVNPWSARARPQPCLGALASRIGWDVRIEESWSMCWTESMVGGNDLPHRDVIQREISRVLVLNLSGEKRGARHCKGDLRP